jgi:hypothetical protein
MRDTGHWKGISLMQLPDRPNLRYLRDQAKDLRPFRRRSSAAEYVAAFSRRLGL